MIFEIEFHADAIRVGDVSFAYPRSASADLVISSPVPGLLELSDGTRIGVRAGHDAVPARSAWSQYVLAALTASTTATFKLLAA